MEVCWTFKKNFLSTSFTLCRRVHFPNRNWQPQCLNRKCCHIINLLKACFVQSWKLVGSPLSKERVSSVIDISMCWKMVQLIFNTVFNLIFNSLIVQRTFQIVTVLSNNFKTFRKNCFGHVNWGLQAGHHCCLKERERNDSFSQIKILRLIYDIPYRSITCPAGL